MPEPQRHQDAETKRGSKHPVCPGAPVSPSLGASKAASKFLANAALAALFLAVFSSPSSQAAEEPSQTGSEVYARAKALYETQDRKAAFNLFKQAADQGDPECAAAVGFLYDSGEDGIKNPAQAVRYLRQGAEGGVTKAQYNLAMTLRRSPAKSEALDEAIFWLNQAAEGNFERAQIQLGEIYYFGDDHTPRNYQTARYYLEKATAYENPQANHLLGLIFLSGLDAPKDPEKARTYLTLAARKGHAKAQAVLGKALATGKEGVKKDMVQGLFWLHVSAEQGEALAQNSLGELQMAADEKTLAAVEQAVAQWQKDPSSVSVID